MRRVHLLRMHGMMKRSSMPKSPSHTLLAFCIWCMHLLCLVERCKAQATTNATTDPSEVRALNSIFQQWNLSASDGWNISGEPCSGIAVDSSTISNPGIKCNCSSNGGSTCHITQMKLQGWRRVRGVLPEELQNLAFLTDLDISSNNFVGSFSLGNLGSLQQLNISYNNFANDFAESLRSGMGNWASLQQLDISYNNFTGWLPPELGNFSSLQKLDISNNNFSNWLPPQLGNLSSLQQLDISYNHFAHSLPPELGKLSSLQQLDISYNNFTGFLPPELRKLSSLQQLDISYNNFIGWLPNELGDLTSLQQLNVSHNNFNRSVPTTLGKLARLQQLDISHNNLSGSVPPELGNLASLQRLYMDNSRVSGGIPSTFADLTKMKTWSASDNNFTGNIPAFIGSWNLTDLNLSKNYITGSLPASIGNLTNMRSLNVGINAISGSIPKELGNLRNLISLDISSNNFSGSLPPALGNLTSLQELYMDSSRLSGEIPSTFASLRNMKILWASDNNFTGKIPDFIGSWNLTNLNIQGNAFEGSIPSSFSSLTSLTNLQLSDVSNGGSSLNFIENMTSLTTLVLRNNMLSGTIPFTIGKHQFLTQMDLSFNNLSGQIPESLFNISSLVYLFLGNNSLSGILPSNKSDKLLNVDLSYNQLSGSFPSWVTEEGLNLNLIANNFVFDNSNRSGLPLSLNCLQRSFPCHRSRPIYSSLAIRCGGPTTKIIDTEYEADNAPLGPVSYNVANKEKWVVSNVGRFSEGSNTRYQRYSQDVFSNTTDPRLFQYARLSPRSLRYYGLGLENGNYTVNLKFVETEFPDSQTWESVGKRIFDIYLQGKLVWKDFNIKDEAGIAFRGIEKEQWVMVYENVLEIHLLWAGKGTCCIPSPGTYGPTISAIRVTPNFKPTVGTPRKKSKTALAVGISVAVVLSIVFVFVVFIWKRSKRSSIDEDKEFLGMGPRPNTFSYAELKTATEDFSPAKKLGQGGFGPVFEGTLQDGRMVAVKQLAEKSLQGKSEFIAEIAAISAVQHRNLVKLYGCCIEGENKLLVYEYLKNKSLDQALFGKSNLHLDWHTRFEICLGTARGLAYLHEESMPRIVHRDVKASNILLDMDLKPKISDFGLAKLYDDKMTHINTRPAGTFGYLAPEYAMRGHLTEKVDVFGFGVVALEIVSGRPNKCENVDLEKTDLLEWAWHLHENNRALELVDPTLSEFNEGEVVRMISIAFLCIQTLPSQRPPMSRVVAMLLGDIEVGTISTKPSYLTGLPSDDTSSFMIDVTSRGSTGVTTSSTQYWSLNASSSPRGTTEPMLHEVIGNGQ